MTAPGRGSQTDVCVVGSSNEDLVARTPRIPKPGETILGTELNIHAGGKGLNQAIAAARSGASTRFVSAVGDDDAGRRLRQIVTGAGIDDQLATSSAPTGRAMISVDDHGENAIVVIPGANQDINAEIPFGATVLLTQLEIPLGAVARIGERAREQGITAVLNPAPARRLDPALLGCFDYVIPNQHEVEELGGAKAVLAAGCRAVLITRGAAGVDVVTTNDTTRVAPFVVEAIDTTGAGDAFCGAFAARLAIGDSVLAAARWAAAAGALATTVEGAVASQPTAEAVEGLIASGSART